MKDIKKYIRDTYPAWHEKKSSRPRPPEHIREANGRRPNARQTEPPRIATLPEA